MNKPELLLEIVTNLRSLATSLEAASVTMLMDAEADTPAPTVNETTSVPKVITLEQVRAILRAWQDLQMRSAACLKSTVLRNSAKSIHVIAKRY